MIDLIWALLNYQNGQLPSPQQTQQQHQHQQQHVFAIATTSLPSTNGENIAATVINKTNSNQCEKHVLQQQGQQQKQQPKTYDNNDIDFSFSMSTNEGSSNLCTDNKPNIQNTANTNNTSTPTTTTNSSIITTTINQSMPINTKENCKIIQNSTLETAAATTAVTSTATTATLSATPIISSSAPVPVVPPTLLPLTLPPGITTVSQLATEYVIVKQYHHCEEYLDGSTKVFDVLPRRDGSHKKEVSQRDKERERYTNLC